MTFRYGYKRGSDTQTSGVGGATRPRSFFANNPLRGVTYQAPQQTDRGFPERITPLKGFFEKAEGEFISGAGRVIQTPAAALNRPLALINYALGKRKGDDTGPINQLLEEIGKQPVPVIGQIGNILHGFFPGVKGPQIKDIVEQANVILEKDFNLTSSWLNSGDAQIIREAVKRGISDDTELTQALVTSWLGLGGVSPIPGARGMVGAPRTDGLPILGALGISGRPMTLGEFKAQLQTRGFNVQTDPETGEQSYISWEDVARKASTPGDMGIGGEYMFGDKAVNDSELVNMAWRMGTDPMNLAFGAGLVGKGARAVASWSRPSLMTVAPSGTVLKPASWGVGYLDDMGARIGRVPPFLSGTAAVRAIQANQLGRVTLKGLGLALRAPKAVFMPGPTLVERQLAGRMGIGIQDTLLRRYVRGNLRLQLGGAGVEFGSGVTADLLNGPNDEDNIISKPFSDLHDASEAIMNDNPLANDPLFIMIAAFGTPVIPTLKSDFRAIRGAGHNTFGPNTVRAFAERFEPQASVSRAASPLGILRGRTREANFLKRFDEIGGFGRVLNLLDEGLVKAQWTDDFRLAIESFDELAHGGSFMADVMASEVEHLRATGGASISARLTEMDLWARTQGQRRLGREGEDLGSLPAEYNFAGLPPEAVLEQLFDYFKIQDKMHSQFKPIAGAVVARAGRLTRDDLELLLKVAEKRVVGGNIDTSFLRSLIMKHPAMLEDATVNRQFWATLMNLGVAEGTGIFKGTQRFTYDWATVKRELESLLDNAPTRKELFHEAVRAEQMALPLQAAPIGPITEGGVRRISSVTQLEALRQTSDPMLRSLVHDIRVLRERYNARWDHHGNLRPGQPLEPALARQKVAPSRQTIDKIRIGEQVEMKAKRAEARRIKHELTMMEMDVADLRTVKIHDSFFDKNGNPLVTGDSLNILKEQTRFINENAPGQYQLERGPGVTTPWKMGDSHITALLQERSNLGQVLFDYGPIAKLTRFVEYLTEPNPASVRARDARQQVANIMLPLGATPAQVTEFYSLAREAANEYKFGRLELPLFRGITALPISKINLIGQRAFGDSPAFMRKYNGRYDIVLDEASNSYMRRIDTKVLMNQPLNRLERLTRSAYWHWQRDPGFGELAGAVRLLSRVIYPLFRFTIDPRWIAMNLGEADIIAYVQDGINGTRRSRLIPTDLQSNAVAIHANRSRLGGAIPEGKAGEDLGIRSNVHPQELRDEMGAFLTNRFVARVIRNQFVSRQPATIAKVINSFPRESGVYKTLVDKFGPNEKDWATQVADMVYGFDKNGVEATVMAEARRTALRDGWTAQEYTNLRPLLRQLVELNQKTMDDLVAVHVGNVDRSRLERLGNSYWLFWPLSYQIKATKWLVGALTQRAGGAQTNLGGLWTVNRLHDEFLKQTALSPEFREQMKNDETIWFTAGMLVPITPFDIGISLNRGVRYVGGNVLGWWPAYESLDDPFDLALKMLELGPIYTATLLQRIFRDRQKELERNTEPETDGGGWTPPTY